MADELAADGDVDGRLLLVTSDHPHLSTRQAKTFRSKFNSQNGAPSFVEASTRKNSPQPVNSSCQDSEKLNCHNQVLGYRACLGIYKCSYQLPKAWQYAGLQPKVVQGHFVIAAKAIL